jgi:hypothetical protein
MRHINGLLILLMLLAVGTGTFSCKSQKKLAQKEAAAAEARKIAKAKADLEALLRDDNTMSLQEKENTLQSIKDMNIEDAEVQQLITRVEDKLQREREAMLAKERAERLKREREEQMQADAADQKSLDHYFNAIAGATNLATANRNIQDALNLFASESTPVLVIIHRSGDIIDYDEPTTIKKYLEYLKDKKANLNAIENVVYDANGKITELELIKK